MHAMMAFAATNRVDDQQRILAAQDEAMGRDDDNAAYTRDVGRPATLAMQAYVQGDRRGALSLLRAIRPIAHRFGGSHAQRDIIDLTMIEAAWRGDDTALAAALAHERHALRPESPHAQALVRRASPVSTVA